LEDDTRPGEDRGMATETSLQALISGDRFEAMTASTDEDADAAESDYDALLGSSEVKGLGSAAVADYKADFLRMDKARSAFNAEFNKAVGGGSDSGKLLAVYERYLISLSALEAQNERFQALADARVATLCKAVAAFILLMLSNGRKRVVTLEAELKLLSGELKKAEKAVEGAKLQRTINTCISAVTLLAGPTTVLARVLVAGGGVTAQLAVDYALGSSKGSAEGATVTVLGGAAEGIDKLGTAGKKFVSAAASVVSFKFDTDEIGEAEAAMKKVVTKLEKTVALYEDLIGVLEPLGKKAQTLRNGLHKASKAAKDALERGADARNDYADMKKLLKQ
jgi:hypothetical protein